MEQTATARVAGLLGLIAIVVFVAAYWLYEEGVPGVPNTNRLAAEADAQAVASVEQGHGVFTTYCARCHGASGEGGIGPVLADQSKLFVHLNPAYLHNVLTVGGRYVCGNARSLMPIWSDTNGGPLSYVQVTDLIAYIRAPASATYVARDPTTKEPILDTSGRPTTFHGWRDTTFVPAPGATPVPDCWSAP